MSSSLAFIACSRSALIVSISMYRPLAGHRLPPRRVDLATAASPTQGASGMTRKLVTSGSPFEAEIGYSRAVVEGEWVFVSGHHRLRLRHHDHPGRCRGAVRAGVAQHRGGVGRGRRRCGRHRPRPLHPPVGRGFPGLLARAAPAAGRGPPCRNHDRRGADGPAHADRDRGARPSVPSPPRRALAARRPPRWTEPAARRSRRSSRSGSPRTSRSATSGTRPPVDRTAS